MDKQGWGVGGGGVEYELVNKTPSIYSAVRTMCRRVGERNVILLNYPL